MQRAVYAKVAVRYGRSAYGAHDLTRTAAPWFAKSLLHGETRHSTELSACYFNGENCRHFATQKRVRRGSKGGSRSRSRKSAAKQDGEEIAPAYLDTLVRLRTAIDDCDVGALVQAYGQVRSAVSLGEEDTAALAQALHTGLRRTPEEKSGRLPAEFAVLADVLVNDIRQKTLPPSPIAHLHLLSFFKEARQFDKGSQFWAWLVQQDDSHLSQNVYGAAIELLAIQGRPATELEDLYGKALKRFPGAFNEYHLSHNSIVPDRAQPIEVKGIPMTLLQGIVTARLLRGNSSDAYLGLDTALRLHPTYVPSRLFSVFIQERPTAEAYTVFLLACRAGCVVGQDALKLLSTKLRNAASESPLTNVSAIRAILTAIYAYTGAGLPLAPSHLTEVVIGITTLLSDHIVARLSESDARLVTDQLMILLRQSVDIFASQGIIPSTAAFNSIVFQVVGRGRREDLLATVLSDMQGLGVKPNTVTYRSIITAAGDLGNEVTMQAAWRDLVQFREQSGAGLEEADWFILAVAAMKCKSVGYVHTQMAELSHALTSAITSGVERRLTAENMMVWKARTVQSGSSDPIPLLKVLDDILQDFAVLVEQLRGDPLQNFFAKPLPMTLGRTTESSRDPAVDEDMRTLYDELTSDRSSRTPAPEGSQDLESSAMTTTGFPYDELRYQNWVTINELLAQAEQHDNAYVQAVDEAIRMHRKPPKRDMGWKPVEASAESGFSVGLSDGRHDLGQGAIRGSAGSVSLSREEVLRLRGRSM